MLGRLGQRGDTLIEVLFAISVFSMVAVGAITIMNQGSNTSERSLEITLVRQQIDGQAETLRYLHDAFINASQQTSGDPDADPAAVTGAAAQWSDLVAEIPLASDGAIATYDATAGCPTDPLIGSFFVDPNTATYQQDQGLIKQAATYSQLVHASDGTVTSEGLWIQATKTVTGNNGNPDQNNADYIDFTIKACWAAPGSNIPMTLQTIVRLYEPKEADS